MDEPRHWHLGWKHKRGYIAATERECRSSLRCAPFYGDLCSLHWPGDAKPNLAKQHENNMRSGFWSPLVFVSHVFCRGVFHQGYYEQIQKVLGYVAAWPRDA